MYNGFAHLILSFGGFSMLTFEENLNFQFWAKKITPVYEVKIFDGANVQKFIK